MLFFFVCFLLVADQDECLVNNGGCSHHCVDQPMGFFCRCPDNMKLVSDSQCEGEWQPDGAAAKTTPPRDLFILYSYVRVVPFVLLTYYNTMQAMNVYPSKLSL